MLVDERVQLVPGDRVPHLRCEITTTSCRPRRGNIQLGGPHGSLVPREGPDPISRVAAPQHRLGVKAGADEKDAIRRLAAVVQLRERAVVAGANDGARHRVAARRRKGEARFRVGKRAAGSAEKEERAGEIKRKVRGSQGEEGDQAGAAVKGSRCVDTRDGEIDGKEASS